MANITCSACQEALIWYSAGQLPQDERQPIARHLETCAACQQELTQWQALGEEMRRTRAVLTPPHRAQIWQGIQGQIASHLPSSTLQGVEHMEFEQRPPALLSATPVSIERARRPQWLALVASILVVALAVGIFALRDNVRFGGGTITPRAGEHLLSLSKDIGNLTQVRMVSPTEGWAIGWRKSPSDCATGVTDPSPGAPMLHYHDGAWWEVDTPYSNHPCATLEALDMLSPDEGWAVGYTNPTDSSAWTHCFAMHYTHGSWHDAPINNCLGVPGALYANNPHDIWMIGGLSPVNANVSYAQTYPAGGYPSQGIALVMHYDGYTWQHVTDPIFTQINAETIWGSGPTDITVWGHDLQQDFQASQSAPKNTSQSTNATIETNFVAHYDGHTWVRKPGFSSQSLSSMALISPSEGWATGANVDASQQNVTSDFISHYHDGIWDKPITFPKDMNLGTIVMVSPDEGWAVGSGIVHYSHGVWKTVVAALPNNDDITSLSMTSATEGWAIGFNPNDDGEIFRFTNGALTTVWRAVH